MDEMVDILNSDGSPTGEVRSKKEAHEKGLWHRAAHVWFVNGRGEILMQKRADNLESHPGEWDISAAGHLSAGNTRIQGALREVKEELGIELEEKDLKKIGELHNESIHRGGKYINKEYDDVYVVRKDVPISDITVQKSEISEVKYVPAPELARWVEEKKPGVVMHTVEFKMLFDYLKANNTDSR